ncbi:hypothetical protein FTZ41_25410 [Salmonella enterica]|nr:hypothetical protein [Salmonella enterica]
MWMDESDHFNIVHCIFLLLFYYWLILYRKRKNQIYFHLFMILLLVNKLLLKRLYLCAYARLRPNTDILYLILLL